MFNKKKSPRTKAQVRNNSKFRNWNSDSGSSSKKVKSKRLPNKRRWIIISAAILFSFGIILFAYVNVLQKKFTNNGLLSSVGRVLPGVSNELRGESDGQVNIALIGMRGAGVEGGGLLADTIMILSITKNSDDALSRYKLTMLSVPRDLLVESSDGELIKINALYFKGERDGFGGGIEALKNKLSEISGKDVHYGIALNFASFVEIVDILGGVDLSLKSEFSEPLQFNEVHVCDGDKGGVFSIPTGQTQKKYKSNGKISAEYPLCSNAQPECGGEFTVAAGEVTLNGEDALCYVRSRVTSSDFDRARRQQEVLGNLRSKAADLNVITDFNQINDILNAVGDNMQTDMEVWEMKRTFDLYNKSSNSEIGDRVLEDSEAGLLYAPNDSDTSEYIEYGYVLLPRGDDYIRIHEMFSEFTMPEGPQITTNN